MDGRVYDECTTNAKDIIFIYRQEMLEILNLYGLSHESDLWCRNSTAGISGELEDTAYAELEQLAQRTRHVLHLKCVAYCETGRCDQDTPMLGLCSKCRELQQGIALACYEICYSDPHAAEQAPILSLPWMFATPFLQNRVNHQIPPSTGLLLTAMGKNLACLIHERKRVRLNGEYLQFKTEERSRVGEANVDMSVFAFIEVLEACNNLRRQPRWPFILSRFVRQTSSFRLRTGQAQHTDEWILTTRAHDITTDDEEYCAMLLSLTQPETDELMHEYFQQILDICFEQGRKATDGNFLEISEQIILVLQSMAIKEIII